MEAVKYLAERPQLNSMRCCPAVLVRLAAAACVERSWQRRVTPRGRLTVGCVSGAGGCGAELGVARPAHFAEGACAAVTQAWCRPWAALYKRNRGHTSANCRRGPPYKDVTGKPQQRRGKHKRMGANRKKRGRASGSTACAPVGGREAAGEGRGAPLSMGGQGASCPRGRLQASLRFPITLCRMSPRRSVEPYPAVRPTHRQPAEGKCGTARTHVTFPPPLSTLSPPDVPAPPPYPQPAGAPRH